MKKGLSFCLILIFAFSIQSCFTLNQVGAPLDTKIELTNTENQSVATQFTRTKKVNHFVFGLISPDDAEVEKLIAQEVQAKGGTAAVNVSMKYQQTFVDGLLSVITFSIYSPFTLTVSGDVVK